MVGYVVLVVLTLVFFVSVPYFFPEVRNYASPSYLRDVVLSSGQFGYYVMILFMILSIPLPIPSGSVALAAGYVYGLTQGILISVIGMVIGGTLTFYAARFFGRFFLEKFVDKHHIVHFNHVFKKRGVTAAFISFLIPVFPEDAVIMLLGVSPIRYSTLFLLLAFGNIPRFLLINSLGSDLQTGITLKTIILVVAVVILALVALFREKIKRVVFKEIKELERDIEKEVVLVEKEVGLKKKGKRVGKK